jgi:hypothetical protein
MVGDPPTGCKDRSGVIMAVYGNIGGMNRCRVVYSPDGSNMNECEGLYTGPSPVISLAPYRNGLMVSYACIGGRWDVNRVIFVENIKEFDSGEVVYEGPSLVTYLTPLASSATTGEGCLLAVFAGCGDDGKKYQVRLSEDGKNLASGAVRFDGYSAVCGLIPFGKGVICAFCLADQSGQYSARYTAEATEDIGEGEEVYRGYSAITALSQFSAGTYADAALVGDGLFGDSLLGDCGKCGVVVLAYDWKTVISRRGSRGWRWLETTAFRV